MTFFFVFVVGEKSTGENILGVVIIRREAGGRGREEKGEKISDSQEHNSPISIISKETSGAGRSSQKKSKGKSTKMRRAWCL